MSRRASWTLIALFAWTTWVWITFMWIIDHQDHPMGFKVVHGLLAVGSIAFGVAAGWIGYRGLRPVSGSVGGPAGGPRPDRRPPKSRIGKPWALGSVPGLMTSVPAPASCCPFDRTTRAYRQRWWILGVLCLSLLVIIVDNSILNVALPQLQKHLGATFSQLQWMVDSYTLVFACLLLTAGSLGDRFGRKGALQLGMIVFGTGSLMSALVNSPSHLIMTRALMGVGGVVHHAVDVVVDHERVPARGARPRHLLLGRDRGHRRRARPRRAGGCSSSASTGARSSS